jgi:hypothetical protein
MMTEDTHQPLAREESAPEYRSDRKKLRRDYADRPWTASSVTAFRKDKRGPSYLLATLPQILLRILDRLKTSRIIGKAKE